MSFGIIFIGNGELSKKDYARYIEKHKLREVRRIKTKNEIIFFTFPPNTHIIHWTILSNLEI